MNLGFSPCGPQTEGAGTFRSLNTVAATIRPSGPATFHLIPCIAADRPLGADTSASSGYSPIDPDKRPSASSSSLPSQPRRSSAVADDRSRTGICFLETQRRVAYHEPRAVGAAFVSPALQRWETIPKTRRSPVGTALASDSGRGSRDLQVPEHRSRNHPAFRPGDLSLYSQHRRRSAVRGGHKRLGRLLPNRSR